jgi:hypothetical protein
MFWLMAHSGLNACICWLLEQKMAILAWLVVTKNGLNGPIQGLRIAAICLRKPPFNRGYPVINIAHPTGCGVKKVICSDQMDSYLHLL